jgi:cytosine permease
MRTICGQRPRKLAHELVPLEDQGSGWRIFFIVAGSQCGLPAFLLGAQLAGSLGLIGGARAAITGALVLAALASVSAYTGSRTRMSLAILSTLTFGSKGAQLVRLLIALSLVGWFGVAISVLGATASGAIADMTGHLVAPPFLSVPLSLAIAWVAMRGAQGLERLGMVLIPLALRSSGSACGSACRTWGRS